MAYILIHLMYQMVLSKAIFKAPLLFCVYFDVLLVKLKNEGAGCWLGNWFVAALGYADDVLLLAPTPRALRRMLSICEHFAKEYNVIFNCDKSKCLNFIVRKHARSALPTFTIGDEVIENVHKWSHLGHTFNDRLSDDDAYNDSSKLFNKTGQ